MNITLPDLTPEQFQQTRLAEIIEKGEGWTYQHKSGRFLEWGKEAGDNSGTLVFITRLEAEAFYKNIIVKSEHATKWRLKVAHLGITDSGLWDVNGHVSDMLWFQSDECHFVSVLCKGVKL